MPANVFEDAIDIAHDVTVPVPNDPIAVRFEEAGALSVRLDLRRVLTAIQLDDQPRRVTDEVRDGAADHDLGVEAPSVELAPTQAGPQPGLRIRLPLPQHAGNRRQPMARQRSDFSATSMRTSGWSWGV